MGRGIKGAGLLNLSINLQKVKAIMSPAVGGINSTQLNSTELNLLNLSINLQKVKAIMSPAVGGINSTQLNSTENYGRRCLTPLSPHHNYILS